MSPLVNLIVKEIARRNDMSLDEFVQVTYNDPEKFLLYLAEIVYGMK